MPGSRISHYEILEKLGEGGMGVVYLAQDTLLNRRVALKFLSERIQDDKRAKERLVREAKSAAAIDHPYICSIYEIGEAGGRTFIAMEYVVGISLKDRLKQGPLPPEQVVANSLEICEALAAAHASGIVHRDLKPANIILTRDGHAKVMDFGIAKRMDSDAADQDSTTLTTLTQPGTIVGSPAYMSPEQIRGQPVDARSDVFSFGIVICEMLSGIHPFWKGNSADTSSSILNDHPKVELQSAAPPLGGLLRAFLGRMMAKDPAQRFQSAEHVRQELHRIQSEVQITSVQPYFLRTFGRALVRPRFLIVAVALLALIVTVGYRAYDRTASLAWARHEAIPEIERLALKEDYREAFALAKKAERYLPEDPKLLSLWPEISWPLSVASQPGGADVFIKDYDRPADDWESLGRTPLAKVRVSRKAKRIRLSREGCHSLEIAWVASAGDVAATLPSKADTPDGMVFIPGGERSLSITGLDHLQSNLTNYWIDKWEVTNKQFAQFLEAGGYRGKEFWKHPFVKDGATLSWEAAMLEFRDRTGRPGPATWEVGVYREGQENYPVCGVSWYEAAAYAEFAGKSLPTVFHWSRASSSWLNQHIVALSNFGTAQAAAAGAYAAVSQYGVCDMAGNVKEWCWNATSAGQAKRYILGGAFNEPEYMFNDPDAQSPFDRLPTYGFRCIKLSSNEQLPETVLAPVESPSRDYSQEKPVPQDTFDVYAKFYNYDKTELSPVIESSNEQSEHWIKQKVSINAAYGRERVTLFLFLPKNYRPPYQPIIYFPHSGALRTRSNEELQYLAIDFVIRSGRAVCYPIYQSTYERDDGLRSDRPNMSNTFREHIIHWYQDLARSIDYLETREDLEIAKLGYYGPSWGAVMGAILPALEKRIKACVFVVGGFWQQRGPAETEQLNFAPRVTVPVLMLNGKYDWIFPVQTSQIPMFRWLGTPDQHKRHLLYDTGHSIPRNAQIKETLDWFDRYLGSVK